MGYEKAIPSTGALLALCALAGFRWIVDHIWVLAAGILLLLAGGVAWKLSKQTDN